MVMTLRTIGSHTEVYPTERLDAVGRVHRQIFFVNGPPFIRGHVASLKTGRD